MFLMNAFRAIISLIKAVLGSIPVLLTGTVIGVVAASIFGGALYGLFEEEDPAPFLFAFTSSCTIIGTGMAVTCQLFLSRKNSQHTARLFVDLINKER